MSTDPTQASDPAQQKLEDIEQYRMQMAGISTAAIGYWKEGDSIHPDYDTVALRDVARLYAKYDALYKAAALAAPAPQAPVAWLMTADDDGSADWVDLGAAQPAPVAGFRAVPLGSLAAPQAAPATVKDSLTAQSPAEGDAGLTDEQAEAIAAFYDVSPGTVHDIYALSKPKAASDTQPKGTPAGMVLVEGAAFHDGSVSLMRHDAVESFCARRGAERLYRLTAAQSPAPAQCTPALKRHALEAADRLAMYAAAPFFPDTEKRGVKRATTAEWWDGLAELIEEAQPLIKRGLHECTAPLADLQAPAVKADPLTEPGVQRLVEQYGPQSEDEEIGFRDGVRASERAHGIGEAQPPVQQMGGER